MTTEPSADIVALFDAATSGIAAMSVDKGVIHVNRRTCEIIEMDQAEAIGRSPLEFLPPDDVWAMVEILQLIYDGAAERPMGGPTAMNVIASSGTARRTSMYSSYERDPRDDEVILVTSVLPDSLAPTLYLALGAVIEGEQIDAAASAVCDAMSGHPVRGSGAVWTVTDARPVLLACDARLASHASEMTPPHAEIEQQSTDRVVTIDVAAESGLATEGYATTWHLPSADGSVWVSVARPQPGPPGDLHHRGLRQAVAVVELALRVAEGR